MRPFSKWAFSLGLLPFCVYFALHRDRYSLLDNADLIIHEAGHFLFRPFGDFVYLMGGSLMQVIFPLLLAGYFFRSRYWPGVQLFLFWLGQNLINISVYAADADTRILPLVGGGRHDWFYIPYFWWLYNCLILKVLNGIMGVDFERVSFRRPFVFSGSIPPSSNRMI